jgi:adenylate kinase
VQVVLDQARESYEEEIVHELQSQTLEELAGNVERVKTWVQQWKTDHGKDD